MSTASLFKPGALLGMLLTSVVLSWMGYVVYNMTSSFSQNDAFIVIAIGYIVLWNAALLQDVLIETSTSFFQNMNDLLRCKISSSYPADYIWPMVSFSAKMGCLGLAMFGAIPAVKASKDILPHNLEIPSSILLGLSLAFLSYKPMRELSNDLVNAIIKYYGSYDHRNFIVYQQQLDLLKEYIYTADVPEMARFTLHLDPDLNTNPYITKHRFQRDELFMFCRPN